jgi:hypothetical protein
MLIPCMSIGLYYHVWYELENENDLEVDTLKNENLCKTFISCKFILDSIIQNPATFVCMSQAKHCIFNDKCGFLVGFVLVEH